jgi:predicted transcriptional regulator
MKAVLISIKPKYCELIASGKKTVEVRKTKPKLDVPFKVYIYETKDKRFENIGYCWERGKAFVHATGKVIGEFVCDKIVEFENSIYDEALRETVTRSCVPMYDLLVYIGKQDYGYGWHISDLVIYDKPRELWRFCKPCDPHPECDCDYCITHGRSKSLRITRPPQSYMYCEEVTE